jgi:hypothetical protein
MIEGLVAVAASCGILDAWWRGMVVSILFLKGRTYGGIEHFSENWPGCGGGEERIKAFVMLI